jgi:hypothetical protein
MQFSGAIQAYQKFVSHRNLLVSELDPSISHRLYLDIEISVAYNLFMMKTLESAGICTYPFTSRRWP